MCASSHCIEHRLYRIMNQHKFMPVLDTLHISVAPQASDRRQLNPCSLEVGPIFRRPESVQLHNKFLSRAVARECWENTIVACFLHYLNAFEEREKESQRCVVSSLVISKILYS